MGAILRRLETGKRWWAAEAVIRATGLVLLGLCAASARQLYRWVSAPPAHSVAPAEFILAMLAVACWALGTAFLFEGPGLFKLVPVPLRHWLP